MMTEEWTKAIPSMWTGEFFVPVGNYWPVYANKVLVAHEIYPLVPEHERDMNSHRHYFAAITEVWKNLPDRLALDYETPTILRKAALIATGYFHERKLSCESRKAALEAYRFLSADIGPTKEVREATYKVFAIHDSALIERRAMSQSVRAMGKQMFQKSKWDTLHWAADLIGVNADDLRKNAGMAA